MTALLDRPATDAPPGPSRAPHPFRVELLRGLAPWAGLALFLTLAWALIAKSANWQGSWGETTVALRMAGVMLGGPLALAAGCWQGARERRRRTDELRASTARGPLAQFMTAALPLALWVLAAYAVTVGAALLAGAPYASPGGLAPTVFLSTGAVLVACALTGHVVGARLPWRLTAPVLAVAAYGTFGLSMNASGVAGLLGPIPGYSPDVELLAWWHPLLTAGWFLSLAATAVLAHAARRRRSALITLAVAATAALVLSGTGDTMTHRDPRAGQQVCTTTTTPQICVNATRAALLPEVTKALSGLTDRLKGVGNLPTRFEDLPRRPHADEAELPMLTPYGWTVVRGKIADHDQYAWEAVTQMVEADCANPQAPGRVEIVDRAVVRYLAPTDLQDSMREHHFESARAADDRAELRRLAAEQKAYDHLRTMSTADRRAWLTRYFAPADRCARTESEVPAL
ncbi:hypothetical protein ACFVTY_22490 [Streptomyces sp. NPDC058067]|uniref:hypothetical protein n=1 Tax=Streptomyces sp. NPDC058067 TaxID=3346324 RepID=UPI0036E2BBD9